MRMLFQVLAVEHKEAKFKNKGGDSADAVKYLELRGIDTDFAEEMISVRVYRRYEKLSKVKAGDVLQVKFAMVKAPNQWEKLPVVNAKQDNIQVREGAENAKRMGVAA